MKERRRGSTKTCPTMEPSRKEEDLRLAGEYRSPKKRVEARMNYGSWRLIEVERTHRQPMFLKEQRTLLLLSDHYVKCQWQSVLIYIYSYVVSVWVYFTFMMHVSVTTLVMPII